jgi:transposase
MQGSKSVETRMFYQISLDQLVPQDHLVRRLAKVVDFKWVRRLTAEHYSHTGRPSIDPVVIAKMLVLGFLYNVTSERQLMRDIQVNLAYRWYLGYDLDESIPNHSILSKARRRLGTEFFEQIFGYVLQECRRAGLVNGNNLLIDSTAVIANASDASVTVLRYTPDEYWQRLETTSDDTENDGLGADRPKPQRLCDRKRSRTDKDATLFRKGGRSMLGYKAHVGVDGKNGVITAVSVTTGSVDDTSAVPKIFEQHTKHVKRPARVVADGQYGSHRCLEYLQKHGVETVIKHRGGGNKHGKLPKELFKYVQDADVYICPSGGKLKRFRTDGRKHKAYYRGDKAVCSTCKYRKECLGRAAQARVVTRYDTPYVEKSQAACTSHRGRLLLKLRQTCLEGLFGQAKSLYGMRRARWRGMAKVLMQVLITAAILNIKKLLCAALRPVCEAVSMCKIVVLNNFMSVNSFCSLRIVCCQRCWMNYFASKRDIGV